MERILNEHTVRVVVVNPRPLFSAPLDAAVLAFLEARYPLSREVGAYTLRWAIP